MDVQCQLRVSVSVVPHRCLCRYLNSHRVCLQQYTWSLVFLSCKALIPPLVPRAGACTSTVEQSFPLLELPTDALTCVLSKLPLGQLLAASTVCSSDFLRSPRLGFMSCIFLQLCADQQLPPACFTGICCVPICCHSCSRCNLSLHSRYPVSSLLGNLRPRLSGARVQASKQLASASEAVFPGHLQRQQVGLRRGGRAAPRLSQSTSRGARCTGAQAAA